jgi:hypothetical protein
MRNREVVLTCELEVSCLVRVGQEGVHLLVVVLVVAACNTESAGAAVRAALGMLISKAAEWYVTASRAQHRGLILVHAFDFKEARTVEKRVNFQTADAMRTRHGTDARPAA